MIKGLDLALQRDLELLTPKGWTYDHGIRLSIIH
jgi:hypothetical protein